MIASLREFIADYRTREIVVVGQTLLPELVDRFGSSRCASHRHPLVPRCLHSHF